MHTVFVIRIQTSLPLQLAVLDASRLEIMFHDMVWLESQKRAPDAYRFHTHNHESCNLVHDDAIQLFTSSHLAIPKLLWCYTALESRTCLPYMHLYGMYVHFWWSQFWRSAWLSEPVLAAEVADSTLQHRKAVPDKTAPCRAQRSHHSNLQARASSKFDQVMLSSSSQDLHAVTGGLASATTLTEFSSSCICSWLWNSFWKWACQL